MKKIKIFVIMALLGVIFAFSKVGFAYGFGVKKNTNNTQPDIGFYKTIIEENNGIYIGSKDIKKGLKPFKMGYLRRLKVAYFPVIC